MGELRIALDRARASVDAALDSYDSGRIVRDGLAVVLAGPPNAGKSSMLNALLGSRRAIVTGTPGTTRDYLEEPAMLDGIPVRYIDTAGLRATDDEAEQAGVAYSEAWIATADVVCFLIDATGDEARPSAIADLRSSIDRASGGRAAVIIAANKADLIPPAARAAFGAAGAVPVSALTGDGLADLASRIATIGRERTRGGDDDVLVTNARHAECLRRASASLAAAFMALTQGRSEELLACDVREAVRALDEIIGIVSTDDVLNAIFSRFCIGK